jgi:anti-sigma factor RsiW
MDYSSGELPPDVLALFARHLSRCVNCERYLRAYEESVKLGRRAFDDENAAVPADVPEGLIQAILAARPK